MINLNECKFGDRLRTKGGQVAVLLYHSYRNRSAYVCAIKKCEFSVFEIRYWYDGKRTDAKVPSEFDIVGKWDDEK